MRPINLFLLSRLGCDEFYKYECFCANRPSGLTAKPHEFRCVVDLVENMIINAVALQAFDGFYFSYSIPQIGKEFDLLKIVEDRVLNVELKSEAVPLNEIEEQLKKNFHYLKFLQKGVALFCYIPPLHKVYFLNQSSCLEEGTELQLSASFNSFMVAYNSDINSCFKVSNYLVSPLNSPDSFLAGAYFLTQQQNEIKTRIFGPIQQSNGPQFYCLRGVAGTGKTLLLYDIAIQCSSLGRCCIIHCGNLAQGHIVLNSRLDSVDVIRAKDVQSPNDLSGYRFIFVDEAHRIYSSTFQAIQTSVNNYLSICVFSCDPRQVLSMKEFRRRISDKIHAIPNIQEYTLTTKIRTNQYLADFIKSLYNKNIPLSSSSVPCVDLVYASTLEESKSILFYFQSKGYVFIHYTPSQYRADSIDNYLSEYSTHAVIGQEFDDIIIIMDHHFHYDSTGTLISSDHPNPDYLFNQLLFQGLTRVRQKLCILVVDNKQLFIDILSILNTSRM